MYYKFIQPCDNQIVNDDAFRTFCRVLLQAAVEEGIVVGGGCALLRLAVKVDAIKETLEDREQQVSQT